jgi:hypothetical protein
MAGYLVVPMVEMLDKHLAEQMVGESVAQRAA